MPLKLLSATWAAIVCMHLYFDHLSMFVLLPSLCLSIHLLCTRFSKHFSSVHSVVIVCAGDILLLFKLLLEFRNVLKHTESRSSFACNQNIKEDIPTKFEVLLCFETKRRGINRSSTKTSTQRASSRPIWGIHSLTLIISCQNKWKVRKL